MRTENAPLRIVEDALNAAGTPEADVVFPSTDQNISRFANSNLHQNMSEISAELTLRGIVDEAMGVASTTSFDSEEIARTAELAREAARHSDPLQNFSGLYRGGEEAPRLRTFHDDVASIAPLDKARALKAMFDRGREHGVLFAGSFATSSASVACGNSHGVRRYGTMTSSEATAIAIKGPESGYATAISRGLVDMNALSEEATLKATLAADRFEDLDPGLFNVIPQPPRTAEGRASVH